MSENNQRGRGGKRTSNNNNSDQQQEYRPRQKQYQNGDDTQEGGQQSAAGSRGGRGRGGRGRAHQQNASQRQQQTDSGHQQTPNVSAAPVYQAKKAQPVVAKQGGKVMFSEANLSDFQKAFMTQSQPAAQTAKQNQVIVQAPQEVKQEAAKNQEAQAQIKQVETPRAPQDQKREEAKKQPQPQPVRQDNAPQQKPAQTKPKPKEQAPAANAMHMSGWFSQAVVDNAKAAKVIVEKPARGEDDDLEEEEKPKNGKTTRQQTAGGKHAKQQPKERKPKADVKNTAKAEAEQPKPADQPKAEEVKVAEQTSKQNDTDGAAAGEESKEENKEQAVSRPFDPEKDGKSWDTIDLGFMLGQGNKKKGIKGGAKKFVQVQASELVRVRNDVNLKLTEEIQFSMTHFAKPNKGLTNQQKINCFMNVCLQSLLACPALFNLLQAISQNPDIEAILDRDGLLRKMVHVSKFFDEASQIDRNSIYANNTINSEHIFEPFLMMYNPDMEQQDACDFLSYLLDQMHEELKTIYVPQENKKTNIANVQAQEEWTHAGSLKTTSVQENTQSIFEPSLIRDIFGGVQQTEIHVEGSRSVSVSHEPFFVLNLEIPQYGDRTLQTCLASYFHERRIHDYQHNGRNVKATHKQLISKLPNMLCIQLKRFIFTNRPIKMREVVPFDEVLTIPDEIVAPSLRVGIFNENRQNRGAPQYRLYSVVEHLGEHATRGHYICYTMDSNDQWKKFDDTSVQARNLETVLQSTQAYILFYELIQ